MHNIPFLRDEEKIVMWISKHSVIYLFIFLIFMAVCVLPAVVFIFIGVFFELPLWSWWLLLWYEIFMSLFVFQKFLEEVMDLLIVTDQRIINIEQKSFFHREVSAALLSQVQDVSYTRDTFFSTIFNFGKIILQTAGESSFFTMDFVADPEAIQERISTLVKV